MQTQLEERSIGELRGLARAFGIKFSFRDAPRDLIERLSGGASVAGLDSLNDRSLVELRTMAQSLRLRYAMSEGKAELVKRIHDRALAKMPDLAQYAPPKPADLRLRAKPPIKAMTQAELTKELERFFPLGLRLTFPAADQWHIQCGYRTDSGTLWQPLAKVLACADKLLR